MNTDPSLFRDRPTYRSRMTMFVAGAVLLHTGFAGLGALWQQPAMVPKGQTTILDFSDPNLPPDSGEVQYVPVLDNPPARTPDSSTPTSQTPLVPDVPTPNVVPEMQEPANVMPSLRPRHEAFHSTNPSITANFAHSVVSATDGVSGATNRASRGISANVRGWLTTEAPLPANGHGGTLTGRNDGTDFDGHERQCRQR